MVNRPSQAEARDAAAPAEAPLVLIGHDGRRRVVVAADAARPFEFFEATGQGQHYTPQRAASPADRDTPALEERLHVDALVLAVGAGTRPSCGTISRRVRTAVSAFGSAICRCREDALSLRSLRATTGPAFGGTD
jgi:hypothetical protein